MSETHNQELSYREHLSYEYLLLKHIDTCQELRITNINEYMVCVSSLDNILVEELRKKLYEKLRTDPEYNAYVMMASLLEKLKDTIVDDKRLEILENEFKKCENASDEISKTYCKHLRRELGGEYERLRTKEKEKEKPRGKTSLFGSVDFSDSYYRRKERRYTVAVYDRKLRLLIDTLHEANLLLRHKDLYKAVVP